MKTKCCLRIGFSFLAGLILQRVNAQANTKLSNLVAPTAVNVNLLPGGTTGTKNIGSDTKRWNNGYFNRTVYCYGNGNTYGVYGHGNLFGVYGTGSTGVYGSGTTSGVEGSGSTYGVYASGGATGIRGSGGTYGIYGISSGWAGYFSGKVYSSGGYTTSDQRLKQNIRDFASAMDIINKLKPKQYEFRQDGSYKLMNLPQGSHFGLIAQDVEKVLPDLVNETKFETAMAQPQAIETASPLTQESKKTETKSEIIEFKALNYTEFIPVLIKGMQELNDELKSEVRNLKSEINKLKSAIPSSNSLSTSLSSASLVQNIPNPFNHTTTINYTLPEKYCSAKIIITDKNGKTLKDVNVSGSGKGSLNINASTFSSGAYQYSLYIDGRLIDTKQMILAK